MTLDTGGEESGMGMDVKMKVDVSMGLWAVSSCVDMEGKEMCKSVTTDEIEQAMAMSDQPNAGKGKFVD